MLNFLRSHKIYSENSKTNTIQDFILGKKYSDAVKLHTHLRIVREDGVSKNIIMNYCKDRCNVEIRNGIITKITGFY
jgi:hypothetical protein